MDEGPTAGNEGLTGLPSISTDLDMLKGAGEMSSSLLPLVQLRILSSIFLTTIRETNKAHLCWD